MSKLLIVQVAGLSWDLVSEDPDFRKADPVFPALASTAAASFRTGSLPQKHGVVSTGIYLPELRRVAFAEATAAALVEGERIWARYRERGRRVGLIFWPQSLGEDVDLLVAPAPIQKHFSVLSDCYAKPPDFYAKLVEAIGRPFDWQSYRGARASRKSSEWIVAATCAVLPMKNAPDLLLAHLPHLEFDLQRHGPRSSQAASAVKFVRAQLARLRTEAERHGYDFLFYGDCAFGEVTRAAVFPNRRLRGAGLFAQRAIDGMNYADLFGSRAFAMVDHQIAHVFAADKAVAADAKFALAELPGIAEVLDRDEQKLRGIGHRRSGDLLLVAAPGTWFAYPWWNKQSASPDHAPHVEISNKPGYDPSELFTSWHRRSASLDTEKIRGSCGRADTPIAWSSSLAFPAAPNSLLDLARLTKAWLEKHA